MDKRVQGNMGRRSVKAQRGLLLLATALAGVALPQASKADVTLYPGSGPVPSVVAYLRVDAGLRAVGNVDLAQYNGNTGSTALVQAAGNDWGTSMFGVYGASQLSADLQGIYKVESGFNAMNGQFNGGDNSIFNRRVFAGLDSGTYGTITFGKDLFIDNDIYNFDPMIQENMSTSTLVYGRNWGGASNMVQYRSPDWGGFKIAGQASFDNGNQNFNGNTSLATTISTKAGVSAEYDISNLSLYAIYDGAQNANGQYTNLYTSSLEFIGGATFKLNPVTFYAGYENLSAPQGNKGTLDGSQPLVNPGSTYNANSAIAPYPAVFASHAQMTWLGAVWQATPKIAIRGAWYYTQVNEHAGGANLFTAGGEYSLTKNLLLYATAGEVVNRGAANFSADIYAPPPKPGASQFTAYSGISISF
jgi:predicted porin